MLLILCMIWFVDFVQVLDMEEGGVGLAEEAMVADVVDAWVPVLQGVEVARHKGGWLIGSWFCLLLLNACHAFKFYLK